MVAMETVTNQYLSGDTSLACSAETQSKIDAQVVELVRKQHEKALTILKDNRGKLDELAFFQYPTQLEPTISKSPDRLPNSLYNTNYFFGLAQIIQIGRMNVFLSMADISSRKHRIAPVPLGTDPLSSTLKADASSVPGFVLFLISSG